MLDSILSGAKKGKNRKRAKAASKFASHSLFPEMDEWQKKWMIFLQLL